VFRTRRIGHKAGTATYGTTGLPTFEYLIALLLLTPAFGLGWLCGWLWANRPPVRRQPQPEELQEEPIRQRAGTGTGRDGVTARVEERRSA
jgi:hypothetical protein